MYCTAHSNSACHVTIVALCSAGSTTGLEDGQFALMLLPRPKTQRSCQVSRAEAKNVTSQYRAFQPHRERGVHQPIREGPTRAHLLHSGREVIFYFPRTN